MIKINTVVEVIVDRPLGSFHPEYKGLYYPVNYGYVEGVYSLDNEEIDAYILGEDKPLKTFKGKVIAIIKRKDDIEDKLVVCAIDKDFSKEKIIEEVYFMERFFDFEVIK